VLDRVCHLALHSLVFDGGGAADYGTDFTHRDAPRREGARFVADGAGRVYEYITIWADAIGHNQLTLGDRVLDLYAWESGGTRVQVSARVLARAAVLLTR